MKMRFVAFSTKGLEDIVKAELLHKLNAEIVDVGSKRVIFDTNASIKQLTQLNTVDDIGILIAKFYKIKSLDQIKILLKNLDLEKSKKIIGSFRKLENSFSITAGVAASSLKAKDILRLVSTALVRKYSWTFTETEHSNFDIRVFIDQQEIIISVRLTKESLHHRTYKTTSKSGSLKPTVAAAMVQLATHFQSNLKIVDNFCGSGTILCESLRAKNDVYGGDIDPESVNITKVNLANLRYPADDKVKFLDATKTKWQNSFFDCAISNLPWNKQIGVTSITNLYEGTLREYARIVKPSGTLCFLLTKPELFIKYAKKHFPNKNITQLKVGLLGQNPSIVLVQ